MYPYYAKVSIVLLSVACDTDATANDSGFDRTEIFLSN